MPQNITNLAFRVLGVFKGPMKASMPYIIVTLTETFVEK